MARFAATFTITEQSDWDAGDYVRSDKLSAQVMQNIEFFAQSHDHSGDAGDGGTLALANPAAAWFFTNPAGAPFG